MSAADKETSVCFVPHHDKLRELAKKFASHRFQSACAALSPVEFANDLFSKASSDFLERKSLTELEEICLLGAELINARQDDKASFAIKSLMRSGFTSLWISLGDRPFIITSLTETLRELGFDILTLLHPIFPLGPSGEKRECLLYLELNGLSPDETLVAEQSIRSVLERLILATDDYTLITEEAKRCRGLIAALQKTSLSVEDDSSEIAALLDWLLAGGFIFLGACTWKKADTTWLPETSLGLMKSTLPEDGDIVEECSRDIRTLGEQDDLIRVHKLVARSVVHRRVRLMHFGFVSGNNSFSFVGILTTQALAQESATLPFIRKKLSKLIEVENASSGSHDYKAIVDIMNAMPKEEALAASIAGLRELVQTITKHQNRDDTTVSIRFDDGNRGASVLIVLPRDRFNTEVRNSLQEHIEQFFGAAPESSEYFLDLSAKQHARFYFHVPLIGDSRPQRDVGQLRADVIELSRTWKDNLEARLSSETKFGDPSALWHRYANAFPEDYQTLESIESCVLDIHHLEALTSESSVEVSFIRPVQDDHRLFLVSLYRRGMEVTLSEALPILENVGFEVISERCHRLQPTGLGNVSLHRFQVRLRRGQTPSENLFGDELAKSIASVFAGHSENDSLNALFVRAGLNPREVSLLRLYCAYHWQISKSSSLRAVHNAFAQNAGLAALFWEIFETKFSPHKDLPIETRQTLCQELQQDYLEGLRRVSDIAQDRILRNLLEILRHSVRTNFFLDAQPAYVIKIHSKQVSCLPEPRPLYECYVRTKDVGGVHLRTAMIARGGIRWSERYEDYRTEVLGLVKTQKIKNAVIVPSGAKGGFIVRKLSEDTETMRQQVVDGYRTFIRSLLSIADTRQDGVVVHPQHVIVYDGEDPYLVVAADKGTATFSDIANAISTQEFHFWLDDAFASGGSQGYDHKKFGITARGAWESVKRHFKNIDLDFENDTFTAIGIGDMAGDVFGNGMLLSEHMALIAAFNHKHIFLDPNPDLKTSFAERKRLFELPRSQWSDYNPSCISAGGGIFLRFDKEITLSQEVRAALGLGEDVPAVLGGEELIQHILRAPVDLLWNGGIGTYVKASSESQADVSDAANDRVRISASELRAKVVAEGGNLGFTQKARVEYALHGGNIHTDAIDNSGGVDMSDHEVNIKILFAQLEQKKLVTRDQRNAILQEIADDVAQLVLQNNWSHALRLSFAVDRSRRLIEYSRSLIHLLHREGYLDRRLEALPTDEELNARADKKIGLVKPELAVLIAGVKMWLKDHILQSSLPKSPQLQGFLLRYFPERLQEAFASEILEHPLAAHITTTALVNHLVDVLGISFVHRMCLNYSTTPVTVVKCAAAASAILHIPEVLKELALQLDDARQQPDFVRSADLLLLGIRNACTWLISNHSNDTVDALMARYDQAGVQLMHCAEDVLEAEARSEFLALVQQGKLLGLSDECARRVAASQRIHSLLEILWAARESELPIEKVARTFSMLISELHLQPILAMERTLVPSTKWESELLLYSFEDLRRNLSHLTIMLAEQGKDTHEQLVEFLGAAEQYPQLKVAIAEVAESTGGIPALAVLSKLLGRLVPLHV